jgi:Domain of unknown function (DUF4145)
MPIEEGPFVAQCTTCRRQTLATIHGTHREPEDENGPSVWLHLGSCQDCRRGLLLLQGEDESHPEEYRRTPPVVIWPRLVGDVGNKVPESLRQEYEQARTCFEAGAYTAVAVMVRRTLEGVCAEEGIKRKTLGESLKALEEAQRIDKRLLEWATELRVLGNEGAHYTGSQVAPADAYDALALAESFLDYMYTISARFDEFRKRRQRTVEKENEES